MNVDLGAVLDCDTDTEQKTEEGKLAHVIDRGDDDRPAEAIVLEARVLGLTLTALCGYSFIPQRDPLSLPPCQKCFEILEFAADFRS